MTAGDGGKGTGIRIRLFAWLWRWATRRSRERQQEAGWASFDERAVRLGYGTTGRLGAAMDLVKRCQGAEWELKRTANRLERLQQERRLVLDMAGPPGLSPAEIERLAMLAEECGETIQAVGKVLRHGWESQSPYGGVSNLVNLEREVGNIRAVVNLMLDAGDVRLAELQVWQKRKRAKLPKWTHHQADSMPREEQLAMMREIEASQGMER